MLHAATAALAHEDMRTAGTAPGIWEAVVVATEAYFELASTGTVAQIGLQDDPLVLGLERWREIDSAHFGAAMPSILHAAKAPG